MLLLTPNMSYIVCGAEWRGGSQVMEPAQRRIAVAGEIQNSFRALRQMSDSNLLKFI